MFSSHYTTPDENRRKIILRTLDFFKFLNKKERQKLHHQLIIILLTVDGEWMLAETFFFFNQTFGLIQYIKFLNVSWENDNKI